MKGDIAMLHNKKILSGILFAILLVLFLLGERSERIMISIGIFTLLLYVCLSAEGAAWKKIVYVSLSLMFTFVLCLCTAPGVLKPVFRQMEKIRFNLVKSVYERDILSIRSELTNNDDKTGDSYYPAENHLGFLASAVWIRREGNCFSAIYITEWDNLCGYAWISDESCTEWMESFYKVEAAQDKWFYVQIYR